MRDSGSIVLIMRDMVEYFPFFYEVNSAFYRHYQSTDVE